MQSNFPDSQPVQGYPPQQPAAGQSDTQSVKTCPFCGKALPDFALFCAQCGQKLPEIALQQAPPAQPDTPAFVQPTAPAPAQPDTPAFVPPTAPPTAQPDAPTFVPPTAPPTAQPDAPAFVQPTAPPTAQPDAPAFVPPTAPAPAQPGVPQQTPQTDYRLTAETQIPSLFALRCPSCGSDNYQALGEQGSTAQSVGVTLAFGAIGNMVASSRASNNMETLPIQYKCNACGNKFVSAPLLAQLGEMLSAPCTVNFQRMSNFVGAAIAHIVYLNGVKVGPVKNGKSLAFPTFIRYNTIFVTDPHGVVFKDMFRFEAQPGGTVWVKFNRKFQR